MRIAITGGIAEGKSTVMSYLRDLGHQTLSADEIARNVFQIEHVQISLAKITGVALPVAPEALRRAIASDPLVRRKINLAMHGEIRNQIKKSFATCIEVPLLFETCLQVDFDRVWVVTCGHIEQRKRLASRLGSELEADRMISTQLPSEVKLAFADSVIRTDRSEALVKEDVRLAIDLEMMK